MKIFDKIQSWFKKEKEVFKLPEEIQAEKKEEIIKTVIKEVDTSADYGKRIEECTLCKEPIESYQKRRKFGGEHYYHKKCFKATMSLAKEQLGA